MTADFAPNILRDPLVVAKEITSERRRNLTERHVRVATKEASLAQPSDDICDGNAQCIARGKRRDMR